MNPLTKFLQDHQGRKFKNNIANWPVDFHAILRFLETEDARSKLLHEASKGHPALAGVVEAIENRADVAAYLRTTDAHETYRFRQAVGVAVRLVMAELGWETTGRKGTLGRRVRVPAGTTTPGAYRNDPAEPAVWFSKAEIYRRGNPSADLSTEPPANRPQASAGTIFEGKTPQDRLARLHQLYEEMDSIGTPEEREETRDFLMKALAETRRTEGREL